MNIQETFDYIEFEEKRIGVYTDTIKALEQDILNAALKLLKEQYDLEIGCQYSHNNKICKLSKINVEHYSGYIVYLLIGFPTKKDGEFSKREQFINRIIIQKEGRL